MHGDEQKEPKKSPRGKKHGHHKKHTKKESHHINAVQPVVDADIASGPTTNINVTKLNTQQGSALNSGSDKARRPPAVEVQLATGDSLTVTNREKSGAGGGFDEASRKQLQNNRDGSVKISGVGSDSAADISRATQNQMEESHRSLITS